MILQQVRTITRQVFTAICSSCYAEGPGAVDPHDAHALVIDNGWWAIALKTYPDESPLYICPICQVERFDKTERAAAGEFLAVHEAEEILTSQSDVARSTLYRISNGTYWIQIEGLSEDIYLLARVGIHKEKEEK